MEGGEWGRLVLHAFVHLSEWHLYYNMSSLLYKGRSLERAFGTSHFAAMVSMLVCITGVVMTLLAVVLSEGFGWHEQYFGCSAGFSGVLFALKVVLQRAEGGTVQVLGFPVWASTSLFCFPKH